MCLKFTYVVDATLSHQLDSLLFGRASLAGALSSSITNVHRSFDGGPATPYSPQYGLRVHLFGSLTYSNLNPCTTSATTSGALYFAGLFCRKLPSRISLARSVAWKFETEDYIFHWSLGSHVHACLRVYDRKDEDFHDDTMQQWSVMAWILEENGSTRDTLQLPEQVMEFRKSKLGEDYPGTLQSTNGLAIQYGEAGQRAEALQLTEQVVRLRKNKLGENHPETLQSMENLAVHCSGAGRRAEALELAEQVVGFRKNKLSKDHLETLASMHSLAVLYGRARRRAEARNPPRLPASRANRAKLTI